MEDKMEMFRKQMEEMRAKGFGFMMVGTDDPKEAAEIMKVAADMMAAHDNEDKKLFRSLLHLIETEAPVIEDIIDEYTEVCDDNDEFIRSFPEFQGKIKDVVGHLNSYLSQMQTIYEKYHKEEEE